MQQKTTIKQLENYFNNDLQMSCKHNLKALKYAFNKLNKDIKIDIIDLIYLIFENRPIKALYTHSYNFHTKNGRYIIDAFKNLYHTYDNKTQTKKI